MGMPMLIRAKQKGENTEVKVLVKHDMETGRRKDEAGNLVPAHFIKTISASCEGKIIFEGELGPAVSKDPFLSFSFKNGKKGDKVSITWVVNKDDSRTDETNIR